MNFNEIDVCIKNGNGLITMIKVSAYKNGNGL